jgi:hypothetical protein
MQHDSIPIIIEAKHYGGIAHAIADTETSVKALSDVLQKYPYQAEFYGLCSSESKQADMEDVRRVASKMVVIQIRLEVVKIQALKTHRLM